MRRHVRLAATKKIKARGIIDRTEGGNWALAPRLPIMDAVFPNRRRQEPGPKPQRASPSLAPRRALQPADQYDDADDRRGDADLGCTVRSS
jgi:hypothetical protein